MPDSGEPDETTPHPPADRRLVLVDADAVAGWRRPGPSLAQLHQAVLHLMLEHPGVEVAVLADPSLKWQLDAAEQAAFDGDIVARLVVCTPAGAVEGTHGFIAAVADRARHAGWDVLAVTDRALPGIPLARIAVESSRWHFDLDGAAVVERRVPKRAAGRRRTRRS